MIKAGSPRDGAVNSSDQRLPSRLPTVFDALVGALPLLSIATHLRIEVTSCWSSTVRLLTSFKAKVCLIG